VRKYLPAVAYRFSNGPYRNAWVIYGHDPRLNPDDRMFQTLTFLVPEKVYAALGLLPYESYARCVYLTSASSLPYYLTRMSCCSSCNPSAATFAPMTAQRASKLKRKAAPASSVMLSLSASDRRRVMEDVYHFRRPPTKTSAFYQLCDILLDEVKELLEKAAVSSSCDRVRRLCPAGCWKYPIFRLG